MRNKVETCRTPDFSDLKGPFYIKVIIIGQ